MKMWRQQHRLSNLEALYCKWSGGGVMELGKLRCRRSTSDWLILLLAIGFGMLWLAWGVHHYSLCFWSTDRLFWPIFLIHCDFVFFFCPASLGQMSCAKQSRVWGDWVEIRLGIYLDLRVRIYMMPVLTRMVDWVSNRPAGRGPFFIFLNSNCKR